MNKEQRAENKEQRTINREQLTESREKRIESYIRFLENYKKDIAALPGAESKSNYFNMLNEKEKQVFTTLLPYLAAVRKREPGLTLKELILEVKKCCVAEIEKVIRE